MVITCIQPEHVKAKNCTRCQKVKGKCNYLKPGAVEPAKEFVSWLKAHVHAVWSVEDRTMFNNISQVALQARTRFGRYEV
ncbi:hypothetical protein K4F52_010176 [Lecanicillium sp. MT-2017a]|nr:hypothetical protein K4F52_010176 [Lecanicillium sp. MT-2017a]